MVVDTADEDENPPVPSPVVEQVAVVVVVVVLNAFEEPSTITPLLPMIAELVLLVFAEVVLLLPK